MNKRSLVTEGLRDNPMRLLVFVRSLLVLCAGGYVLFQAVSAYLPARGIEPAQRLKAGPVRLFDVIWCTPVLVGIVAEFVSFRVARVVNVGYYGIGALYILVGFVLSCMQVMGFRESEHWILFLLFMGLPYVALFGFLWVLYRVTSPPRLANTDAV